jgi:hypothetical protein
MQEREPDQDVETDDLSDGWEDSWLTLSSFWQVREMTLAEAAVISRFFRSAT